MSLRKFLRSAGDLREDDLLSSDLNDAAIDYGTALPVDTLTSVVDHPAILLPVSQNLAIIAANPGVSAVSNLIFTGDLTDATINPNSGFISQNTPDGDLDMGDVEIDDQEVPYFVGFDPTSPGGPLDATNTPSVINSFNTITRQQTGFIPPDPNGAAGPNHLVDVVNANIEYYTKAGVQQNSQTLTSFFGVPGHFLFDPKILYDTGANRFLMVADELAGLSTGTQADDVSRMYVAVSDDSDPNGTWFKFSFNALINVGGTNYWGDYPTLGVDEQAIYISENYFPTESNGNAITRLWIIPKATFYSTGATPTPNLTNPNSSTGLGFDLFTWQPAQVIGDINGTTTGTYLVAYSGLHFISGSQINQEVVDIVRVDNPLAASPTFTSQLVTVGDISTNSHVDAPQSGSGTRINTGDERALQAVWFNNHLYATATVNPGNNQATAHWWDFSATGVGDASLSQQGNIDGEDIAVGTHTFYPSVAVNSSGTVAFGFSASAASIFAGSYYTVHAAGDAAGTVENSQVLRAGLDSYVRLDDSGRNRWGDYSGIALDPADNTSFWVFNENAIAKGTGTGEWGTAWGEISFSSPPPPPPPSGVYTQSPNFKILGDFSGEGTADIFFRNDNGQDLIWTLNASQFSGGFSLPTVNSSWHVGALGDFNGDRTTDLFWHNDNGQNLIWLISGNQVTAGVNLPSTTSDWHLVGVGDFNRDGNRDLLWRNDSGQDLIWNISGGQLAGGTGLPTVNNSWHVATVGDFNADQISDILWHNDNGQNFIWLIQSNGTPAGVDLPTTTANWHAEGVGDFNRDGASDILWHDDSGQNLIWLISGGQVSGGIPLPTTGASWHIAGIGDTNHDAVSDIAWHNDSGQNLIWQIQNGQPAAFNLPTTSADWHFVA